MSFKLLFDNSSKIDDVPNDRSKYNWSAEKHELFYYIKGCRFTIPDKYALLTNGNFLGIVGKAYEPANNIDVFLRLLGGDGLQLYSDNVYMGSLSSDHAVYMLIRIGKEKEVEFYALLMNDHYSGYRGNRHHRTKQSEFILVIGRRKDNNTAFLFDRFDTIEDIIYFKNNRYDIINNHADNIDKMKRFKISQIALDKYFVNVFTATKSNPTVAARKRCEELFYGMKGVLEYPNSVYNAYCAVIYYLDFERESWRRGKEYLDINRLEDLLIGSIANLKYKAYAECKEFFANEEYGIIK